MTRSFLQVLAVRTGGEHDRASKTGKNGISNQSAISTRRRLGLCNWECVGSAVQQKTSPRFPVFVEPSRERTIRFGDVSVVLEDDPADPKRNVSIGEIEQFHCKERSGRYQTPVSMDKTLAGCELSKRGLPTHVYFEDPFTPIKRRIEHLVLSAGDQIFRTYVKQSKIPTTAGAYTYSVSLTQSVTISLNDFVDKLCDSIPEMISDEGDDDPKSKLVVTFQAQLARIKNSFDIDHEINYKFSEKDRWSDLSCRRFSLCFFKEWDKMSKPLAEQLADIILENHPGRAQQAVKALAAIIGA
jgi:hypothetical protein